mgnify:CR=1 FL=1
MVTTADEHATREALAVLREGGGIADAAITAAFVLGVTHPGMCGIGGGGHALLRTANGKVHFLDFRERAPASSTRDMFASGLSSTDSWLAAAVPGTVRALGHLHSNFGTMPWPRLVAPAIRLARDGHVVTPLRSAAARNAAFLRGILRKQPGELLMQPDLADTHERIAAEGADEFYSGQTARRLAAEMTANGGAITMEDLAGYQVAERAPITASYRGYDVTTAAPPSGGGYSLLRMLRELESHDLPGMGHNTAAYLDVLARAMRDAVEERVRVIGDPDFSHTTHFNIANAEGEGIAFTFTLNRIYGSGITVPGLGFLLNNNMDNFATRPGEPNQYGLVQYEINAIEPHKRPVSSMTPAMVFRDGQLRFVTGTPGGPTIPTAVLQVILNVLEFGMNAAGAVAAPRIHHQWRPDVIYHEAGFAPDTQRMLREMGHTLEAKESNNDVMAIRLRDGWLEGAADPRREGTADCL